MSAPPHHPDLRFARFQPTDAEGLARLLADPEITRNITADASSPDKALDSAHHRIAWHNGAWESEGYGVWALRLPKEDRLIGWCGFAEPDFPGEDPEILYGLARDLWGRGLASAAGRAAVDWFFQQTALPSLSAMIFRRLNPGSLKVAAKLGLELRATRPYADFMTDPDLARQVLDYEIWRLREGPCLNPRDLLFQAPYKAGQLVATGVAVPEVIEGALITSAAERISYVKQDKAETEHAVRQAFRLGQAESHVDHYQLTRAAWQSGSPT